MNFFNICGSSIAASILIYLLFVAYVFQKIHSPKPCKYASYGPSSSNFLENCLSPIFEKATLVDYGLYIGAINSDSLFTSGSAKPVWSLRNVSIHDPFDSIIGIRVPEFARLKNRPVYGRFVICRTSGTSGILCSRSWDIVAVPIFFTSLKVPSRRNRERDLLNISTESDFGIDKNPRQHWKYVGHPLIVRYVHLNNIILESTYVPYLEENLAYRTKPSFSSSSFREQYVYEPIIFIDEISLLRSQYAELSNDTSKPEIQMKLQYRPTSNILYGYKKMCSIMLEWMTKILAESEVDEFRWWMSDARLYRLLLTQLMTWTHILLEFLAFRDDWRFFTGRGRRGNYRGLSASSMALDALKTLIFLLYLHDEDSSYIVLLSVAKDLIYGLWKLSKVAGVYVRWHSVYGWAQVPTVSWTRGRGRSGGSKDEGRVLDGREQGNDSVDDTSHLDAIALSHVGLSLSPLLLGFFLYSLLHYKHRSWWSWAINALVDTVYFSGFLSMTPQLYINYKLRSVAHLPIRAFVYKIFSTFVDDLFAFLVKMPWKHRLMTMRDDVIFIIFIYQWWVYPEDKARPNEYGFQYESRPNPNPKDETQPQTEPEEYPPPALIPSAADGEHTDDAVLGAE